ncbi:restriction endonuclease subunit S [Cohnella cellulosilytica]|uniref:Restriction endonuclease subunit S n=1 Tax=Cohnella cellulosilytica TaxID=986710 RepID=A0ABW2F5H9_9BACL
MKCIEDEIPFEVPESWAWARLGSVCSDFQYGTSQKSQRSGDVAVLRMGNLQDGEIDYDDLVYTSDENDIKKYLLYKDELLFNRTNSPEWVGKTAIYRGEMPAIFAGYLIKVSPILINPYFLNYIMNSEYHRNVCLLVKTDGVNQSNINAQKLSSFLFAFPPVAEQQRIVSTIKSALEQISEIEQNKTDLQAAIIRAKSKILDLAIRGKLVPQDPSDEPASTLLERIRAERQELIKAGKIKRDKNESFIFRGDDNSYYEKTGEKTACIDEQISFDVPKGWVWARLSSIGTWQSGATPSRSKSEYYNGNIPWLKTGDLNDRVIEYIPETITDLALRETSVKLNPRGSILIAMYGATIGKLGILSFPATTNQACCACSEFRGINSQYLFFFLLQNRLEFIERGEGGAQPNISKEKIVNTLIPLPPLAEQARIITNVESMNYQFDRIIESFN